MRILILTGKFGMGHLSAANSLCQQLLRACPQNRAEVVDLVAYAMPGACQAVYKCFELLVTRGSGLFNLYYKMTENARMDLRPAFEPIFLDGLRRLLAQRRPDVVIATHPLCAQLVSRYKKEEGSGLPLITCVTDISSHSEWINGGTDCYLVGRGELRRRLADKGVDPGRILVTGIPVKEEFKRISRRPSNGERHLLIMGGGLGLLPKKERFYQQLNSLPGVKTVLIAGRNQKMVEWLDGRYENIQVVGFTSQVHEYMAWADLVLTKAGGITLFETIYAELPLLAWQPFLEQERRNTRFLVERELGRVAGREPEQCLQDIKDLIYDTHSLSRMAANMRGVKAMLEQERLAPVLGGLAAAKGVYS